VTDSKTNKISPTPSRWSPPLAGWARRHPILAFFTFTFIFSWVIWLLPIFFRMEDAVAFRQLNALGAFGPALAGLYVQSLLNPAAQTGSASKRGEGFVLAFLATSALYFICLPYASSLPLAASPLGWGMRALLFAAAALVIASVLGGNASLRRLFFPRGGTRSHWGWYLAALLVYPLVLLAGLGLSAGTGQAIQISLPEGGAGILALSVAASFVYIFMFGGPLNEEPGWRGFALPQLQRSFNPLSATLILGAVWGVWHFPMHLNGFYPSAGLAGLPGELALRVITTVLVAFLYTWFYNKTGGNVLVCMVLHASFNTASAFLSVSPLAIALLAILAAAAIVESRQWRRLAEEAPAS
jgi:membrane protease YdiL (CAAX protease family)